MSTGKTDVAQLHVVGVGSGFKPFYSTTFLSRAYAMYKMLRAMGYKRAYLIDSVTSLDLARRRSEFSSS